MGFATKAMIFENPFPKYKFITLTPYMEVLGGKILFQTIGWEKKILFTQNSFGSTRINVECREIGVKVEKW